MSDVKTDQTRSRALDQDRTDGISCVSSSHKIWSNLGGSYSIQQP